MATVDTEQPLPGEQVLEFTPGRDRADCADGITGRFLSEDGVSGHLMEGVPTWMGVAGIALIILSSHLIIHFRKRSHLAGEQRGYPVIPLFQFRPLRALVKKPWFPLFAQSGSLLILILILTAGLFGSPKTNIAPVLTWTWWWVLLIFIALGLGKTFCMICPWEAVSSLVTSLSLRSRVKMLGFERPWPKWARNIGPAIIFFVILTWFELGHDVTHSPSATAILAAVMVSMAAVTAIVFEKRAFCRYGCLVGRVSGLYAMFAPVELRATSTDVCTSCRTKDCYTGVPGTTTPCPTGLFPSKIQENTYCTLCTECVRSCPHDNLSINLRPFATDLVRKTRFLWDEAVLAIVLVSLTSFHGLTMTPHWAWMNGLLRAGTGLGKTTVFTLLMALVVGIPILVFWLASVAAQRLSRDASVSAGDIFKAFAYSLIPIALFYHLAHNCMHFFLEAQNIVPLLSDPLGKGWDLFGTATISYPPLLSLETIWVLQALCIVVGHVFGVIFADRYAGVVFNRRADAFRGLIPLIAVMVLYSAFSVWLIMQPMDMRTAM